MAIWEHVQGRALLMAELNFTRGEWQGLLNGIDYLQLFLGLSENRETQSMCVNENNGAWAPVAEISSGEGKTYISTTENSYFGTGNGPDVLLLGWLVLRCVPLRSHHMCVP